MSAIFLGSLAARLLGEIVAPTGCCACDERVRARVLFCPTCASMLERVDAHPSGAPPAGTGAYAAAFEYGGAIATAITRLKYQDRADLAPRLGAALALSARDLGCVVDRVVPVPLHPRRLAERGYNQAALVASPVARVLGVPLAPRALARVSDTPKQATLDRAARLVNLEGVFAVRAPSLIQGARVLLVDDVRTTGATLEECVRALRRAGAASVLALVLARRA